jgi:Na+-exporting ATPase
MPSKKDTKSGPTYTRHPFLLTIDEVKQCLDTNPETGLSKAAAQSRVEQYGENTLSGEGGVSWYTVLGKQVSNALILVRHPL